ncbi:MAG: MarR family transcriptional regulator [Myxococcota bacterium]
MIDMRHPTSNEPSTEAGEELVDALVRASFVVMATLNTIGAENDLSLTQLRVLGILRDRRARMTELGHHLGLKKSTMTGLVDRAEQRGLLARATSADDERVTEVFLTAEGAKLVARGRARLADELGPLCRRLSARDQRRLRVLLERLLDSQDE